MNAHAMLTLHSHDGRTLRYTGDAAPQFTVPAIADFYTWATESHTGLSAASYQQFAAGCGTLPQQPHADRTILTPVRARELGLDYLYDLTLAPSGDGLRLQVHDRSRWTKTQKSAPLHTLTHADIYGAAATYCDRLASRADQYAAAHQGLTLPGGDPDLWAARAHAYRQLHLATPALAARTNLAATYYPPAFDATCTAVKVAGVMVFAYITAQGRLRVSVDLDETESWLLNSTQKTVPIDITIDGHDVF